MELIFRIAIMCLYPQWSRPGIIPARVEVYERYFYWWERTFILGSIRIKSVVCQGKMSSNLVVRWVRMTPAEW